MDGADGRQPLSREAALVEAARVRLRPILMTTLAMIFGMVPLAFSLGEGAEQRAPMGQTVIGGIITSSILTLVVVPVIYTYLDDFGAWLAGCGKARRPASPQRTRSPRLAGKRHRIGRHRRRPVRNEPGGVCKVKIKSLIRLSGRGTARPAHRPTAVGIGKEWQDGSRKSPIQHDRTANPPVGRAGPGNPGPAGGGQAGAVRPGRVRLAGVRRHGDSAARRAEHAGAARGSPHPAGPGRAQA
ncbi:hypothetical protein CNECB9_320047 [Cupriavidus necator]|uniref:Cation/multidrug efflux pump n=1 Tax=Cupriavidus necator TaxID=106590 RepID=A0A1K0IGN3_CUPNE|nr:hypothetical protein CNECB9_320047 [Cupriavidus necator]